MARALASSVVVVGTSDGGLEILKSLVAQLPEDFPAPIFVVQHMAADTDGEALLQALERNSPLPVTRARSGERFRTGHIYLAPPDHHMLVGKGRIKVTKGARENRQRPAIDPLFRSAAVAYGSRVIGIVLSGYLDDGTAGLAAIQRCGGTCIVQDPADAAYADMPLNALAQLDPDYCVPVLEMGAILTKVVQQKRGKNGTPPRDILVEARVAEHVLSDLPSVQSVGDQVPFNCPGCGGVLWEIKQGKSLRYRCHTGHAFTAPVLLAEQEAKVEETLWIALRMFEERRNLLLKMASFQKEPPRREGHPEGGNRPIFASAALRAKDAEDHIGRIRDMLKGSTEGPTGPKRKRRKPMVTVKKR